MNSLPEITRSVQGLIDGFLARLPYLAIAVVVFLLFALLGRGLRTLVTRLAHGGTSSRRYVLGLVLGRLTSGLTLLVGALVAMVIAIPGFTPGELMNLLGIGGVAIGFAFRDILQNFLAGLLLLVSEPFRIGDRISVTGFEGVVEDIQTRATFLKTDDGQRVVIPNATLFTNSVTVLTAYDHRRLQQDAKLTDAQDVEAAKRAMVAALVKLDDVAREPAPTAVVQDLTDGGLLVRLTWWVEQDTARHVAASTSRDEVLRAVSGALADLKASATPKTDGAAPATPPASAA